LSLVDSSGVLNMSHNFFKPGYVATFGTLAGTINDDGTSVLGASPGFVDEVGQDYNLATGSNCINAGTFLHPNVLPANDVTRQYVKHQLSEVRLNDGALDIGAYERQASSPAPLLITTSSLPSGTVNAGYSATLGASGGVTPYSWSIISGSLPNGLNLNASTGAISGTPSVVGNFAFTVQVSDSQSPSHTDSKPLSVTVNPATVPPPSITTTSLPDARRNVSYSQTVQATGGVTPYAWTLASGALPAGLTLNGSTGVISGTPTRKGTFNFVVRVRDSQGIPAEDTQSLSIRVAR